MKYIKIEDDNRIGKIIIDRPEKRNAFNKTVVDELKDPFHHFEKKDDVEVIILRAEGKVFSAGADLKYLQERTGARLHES